MKEKRWESMEKYIEKKKEVSIKELQYQFNVSMSTLRSDLSYLEDHGVIKKKYGGVVYSRKTEPFESRLEIGIDAKNRISSKAAEFISSGDTVFIDYGTTTMEIPLFLKGKTDITIITPNMHVIQRCLDLSNINLMVLPGEFSKDVYGMLSENTIKDLANYNIGKAFMSCCGITDNGCICSARFIQQQLKSSVISKAQTKYLLTTSNKFYSSGPLSYSKISDFQTLITDSELRKEHKQLCESSNTTVVLC